MHRTQDPWPTDYPASSREANREESRKEKQVGIQEGGSSSVQVVWAGSVCPINTHCEKKVYTKQMFYYFYTTHLLFLCNSLYYKTMHLCPTPLHNSNHCSGKEESPIGFFFRSRFSWAWHIKGKRECGVQELPPPMFKGSGS